MKYMRGVNGPVVPPKLCNPMDINKASLGKGFNGPGVPPTLWNPLDNP